MTHRPAISLAIVRNKDGKLLLVERAMPEALADATTLTWAFPGGKVEPGEATRHAWASVQDLERFITSSIHPAVSAYLRDNATLPLAEK